MSGIGSSGNGLGGRRSRRGRRQVLTTSSQVVLAVVDIWHNVFLRRFLLDNGTAGTCLNRLMIGGRGTRPRPAFFAFSDAVEATQAATCIIGGCR